jgi:hypothetical protein
MKADNTPISTPPRTDDGSFSDCSCFDELVQLVIDGEATSIQQKEFLERIAHCSYSNSLYHLEKSVRDMVRNYLKSDCTCPQKIIDEIRKIVYR